MGSENSTPSLYDKTVNLLRMETINTVGLPDAIGALPERPSSQQAKSHTRRYQNKKMIRTHLPPGRQGSDYFGLVRPAGFEPPAFWSVARRSIQMS